MKKEFENQKTAIEHAIVEMSQRGEHFLDSTLRLGKIFDLLRTEKLKSEFERVVVADTSEKMKRQVNDIIDGILQKNGTMWKVAGYNWAQAF